MHYIFDIILLIIFEGLQDPQISLITNHFEGISFPEIPDYFQGSSLY